ncbi:MAG: hypothetical protein HY599_02650 [Candidatus Omnitrophica bacterium]|nr:hypothetical protein [Candidatus Omnitrophota bacterium]
MGPSIGRSLQEGFRAANRSWPGIAFLAGSWVLVALVVVLAILATRPPAEIFQADRGEPSQAPATVPAAPPQPAPLDTPPDEAEDVFNQLESAEPIPGAPAPDGAAERSRIIEAWFGGAWPLLLIALLLFIAANVWLNGGQIAYLAKRITTQSARLAEFWATGTKVFGSLFGAWCLAVFGIGALALIVSLLGFLLSLLSQAAPQWVSTALGALVGLGLFIGMVWIAVRLLFWFIAVVMDQAGPVAGLKASLRATQGRWWRVAGLGLVVMALSFGVSAVFGVVEWLGRSLGGGGGAALVLLSNLAGIVANLYLGFAVTGTFVRYYADTKSPATPGPSAAA